MPAGTHRYKRAASCCLCHQQSQKPSCHPPAASSSHCSTWRDIDQVSSAEEGWADQELLEEAMKLEPIHLPVFISSRLLQAAGCILSHPVLAALSAKRKPSHLCEIPAPPLAAVLVQIPAAASLLHGLSAVQIRGFSPAAISYLGCQLLTELRWGCQISQQCHVSPGGVVSLIKFFLSVSLTAATVWEEQHGCLHRAGELESIQESLTLWWPLHSLLAPLESVSQ